MNNFRWACAGGLFVISVMLAWPVIDWCLTLFGYLFIILIAGIAIIFDWVESFSRPVILLVTGGLLAVVLWATRDRVAPPPPEK